MGNLRDEFGHEEMEAMLDAAFLSAEELSEEDYEEADQILKKIESAPLHQFSPEFEARMKAMIEKSLKTEEPECKEPVVEVKRRKMPKSLRNGLVVTACLLVFVGIGTVQSIQSGAVFGIETESFREFCDQFISVTWGSNEKEAQKVVVLEPEPEVLPEGVVEGSRVVTDSVYKIAYVREGERILAISGSSINQGREKQNDNAILISDNVLIGECSCNFYESQFGEYLVVWEKENIFYSITAKLPYEQVIQIVENVIIKNK